METETARILPAKLVSLRKQKGITQMELAEKLNVSRQAISRWEVGLAVPTTDNLKVLSELYGVSIDYLLNDAAENVSKQNEVKPVHLRIPPTIKLRFKARQPAVSFSISKLKLLEWESNWPDATSHGLTRPHGSQSAASLIRSIRFAQIVPPSHSVRSCH